MDADTDRARLDDTAAEMRGYLDWHMARWGEHLDVKVNVVDFGDWVACVESLAATLATAEAARARLAAVLIADGAGAGEGV